MKTNRVISLALILLSLLSSCGKEPWDTENPKYKKASDEIVVNPVADEDWKLLETKSLSDLEAKEVDLNLLKDPDDGGFGVYAYYTGTSYFTSINDSQTIRGLVFNNRKFIWENNTWKNYQWNGSAYVTGKSEFWPAKSSEQLTFFAFAPWSTWNDKVRTSSTYDCPYIVYDDYVAADLSIAELEAQEDILWGTNTFGMAHKNVGMSDYTPEGVVDMHFRHAVAKVHFDVQGSLAGTSITTNGEAQNGTTPVGSIVETRGTETVTGPTTRTTSVREGKGKYRHYRYRTTTYTVVERQEQEVKLNRTARVTVNGKVYLIDNVSIGNFKNSGTLLLDNASAYSPSWILGNSSVTYTLSPSSGNALKTSLQAVSEATLRSNLSTYTGISETPTDMMGGYYLYVLPKESGSSPLDVNLVYKTAEVSGQERVNQVSNTVTAYRTRTITRKFVEEQKSTNTTTTSGGSPSWPNTWTTSGTASISGQVDGDQLGYYPGPTANDYSSSYTWDEIAWNYPDADPSSWTTMEGSGTPIGTPTATYTETKTVSGKINTVFEGGNAYTIKLIVSGKELNMLVIPEPWELEDLPAYTFSNDENWPIQYLDYDSAFVDYEENGNVYINNRMGKFYFQLAAGKYLSWQASLVGDSAFGFTDENGNFLMENGERVSSIRGPIDPNVMNYIYVKAVNTSSTVASKAKLRIYGIDSNGDATALLYLVNSSDVVEWTIIQNAN